MIKKPDMAKDYSRELEKITGHHFTDKARLVQALTHSSVQNAQGGNYERLEFLGDRVLGIVTAEMLFRLFPDMKEGDLSVRLNALVNADTCAQIAEEIGLLTMIHMGPEMRGLSARRLCNIYADAVEALIAVIYLDGGLAAARAFIERYWGARARDSVNLRRDSKTELQEWAHQKTGEPPRYRVVKCKGPAHDPVFEIEVRINGFAPATGRGRSKRQGEQAAAEEMLVREGVWAEENGENEQ